MRIIIIVFCSAVIIGSGCYSYWYSQYHFLELKDYLENEETVCGKGIVLNYSKVEKIGTGFFIIKEGLREVKVTGDIKGIKAGDFVSLKGIFQKDATINLTDYYVSKRRSLKYGVSILAAFLVVLCLLLNFKINSKEFVLVERKPCRTF